MKVNLLLAVLFFFSRSILATPPLGDVCHVYLVDVRPALQAAKQYEKNNNPQALARAEKVFPTFESSIEEEVFTTRHYRFPGTKLFITASVFYTDESLGSKVGAEGEINPESMLLGITVTGKKEINAIFQQAGNAVAEVGYDDKLSTVRVKNYVRINGKLYLVGLECDCHAKRSTNK